MNKKMLGVLLIGGAAVGVYVARRQIQDAILNLRDRAVELVLLGLDDPSEDGDEEKPYTAYPGDEYVVKARGLEED